VYGISHESFKKKIARLKTDISHSGEFREKTRGKVSSLIKGRQNDLNQKRDQRLLGIYFAHVGETKREVLDGRQKSKGQEVSLVQSGLWKQRKKNESAGVLIIKTSFKT